MSKGEWRVKNPCYGCGVQEPCEKCSVGAAYQGMVSAQRKLLEYLIEYSRHTELMKVPVILKPQLVTMLKQLEEQ